MNDEKKPKNKISAETKARILCVVTIIVLWVLVYINDETLESKGLECVLMSCAWFVAVFSNAFVKYWTGRFKD